MDYMGTIIIAQLTDASKALGPGTWVLLGVLFVVGVVFLALFGPAFSLWIQALSAQAKVGILELVGMRLRKVNPQVIVLSKIQAVRAGLTPTTADLENHLLAGGRPLNVVRALIAANRANIRSEERRVGKECRSRWSPDH